MGYLTDGLTFNTLRNGNLERCPLFKNAKGEIAHPKGLESWSVDQWLKAVVGELGEFANVHKKVDRGDFSLAEAQQALADELADVMTYLDLLAARCGVNLGDATMKKWNEVSKRVDVPIYIDAEDWHYDFNHPEIEQFLAKQLTLETLGTASEDGLFATFTRGHVPIDRFAFAVMADNLAADCVKAEADVEGAPYDHAFIVERSQHLWIRPMTRTEKSDADIDPDQQIIDWCGKGEDGAEAVTAFAYQP